MIHSILPLTQKHSLRGVLIIRVLENASNLQEKYKVTMELK